MPIKQGVIEKPQYGERRGGGKTRKATNVYAGRPNGRRKQETMDAYALATTELNSFLGAATLPAMAAAGGRVEEHVRAMYNMSGIPIGTPGLTNNILVVSDGVTLV